MASVPIAVAANDFAAQWEDVRTDAVDAVERVGASGWWILGEEVRAFEAELAQWWGVEHAVGVASGLDALEIGLRCAGIGPGDRVLTTPLTAFATTLAILRAGAEPAWCDVDETGGLDLALAGGALTADPSIRALVPVHLYGHPLDPDGLAALAAAHGVAIVEDCAQAAGAERAAQPTGLRGFAAAVSFYPTKNLGAMGDGGAVLTRDPAVAEHARMLRDYGQRARYDHAELGLNSRLDELHAAVLRSAMLPRLSGWVQRRREVAARYDAGLEGTALQPIRPAAAARSSAHLYPVTVAKGHLADIAGALRDKGVAVGRHYPILCPDQNAAAGTGHCFGELAVARRVATTELSLPVHPYLTDAAVDHVIGAARAAAA